MDSSRDFNPALDIDVDMEKRAREWARHRSLDQSGSVSIFDLEVEAGLAEGEFGYISQRWAIDDFRKFANRELSFLESGKPVGNEISSVTPDAVLLGEGNYRDAKLSAEEIITSNQLFERSLKFATSWKDSDIAFKWICRIFRSNDVEHILRPEFQKVIAQHLGNRNSEFKADLAELCGYAVREGRRVPAEFDEKLDEMIPAYREFMAEVR